MKADEADVSAFKKQEKERPRNRAFKGIAQAIECPLGTAAFACPSIDIERMVCAKPTQESPQGLFGRINVHLCSVRGRGVPFGLCLAIAAVCAAARIGRLRSILTVCDDDLSWRRLRSPISFG